ncbi:oligosaccharide repeat unit polymerase [Clostridium botulinum]|uniref:O-antigen polymerase n=1 Tax=Clostridium botulinum TaxID=1491 RepID=UPI0013755EED|nr:O-antigen polymerase [Clostridium botulinum]NCI22276.1 oligosaccharide repeat unit polymerase [Clostridium botulinum]NCI36753.1 oligosaccharide repeat unit polymerase [Clostridium botulinum]NCI72834.1 oligosaccharide repeat unit polymerase [Clostridium botulinum]NDI39725.1 oligosaccharide repeat unit polymerase [Clostridium botulinum]NEZ72708.1 oligosaccharide repeat unit polymerase [Clostridium botulinum]
MIYNLLMVFFTFAISCILFKKASGTLKPNKLNLISYIFYLFILQSFIGSSLIYLGFREHYLIQKVTNFSTIGKTYDMICFTAIALPLTILLVYKIFNINMSKDYNDYLNKEVILEYEDNIFVITILISIVCLIFTLILFIKMRSIPLIDLIIHRSSGNIGNKRINISHGNYMNQYIQNLLVLGLTPILSYLSYIYYKCTKANRWRILFFVLFIASIFLKTYNYAKTPVVFYIFVFILINIVIEGSIPIRKLLTVLVLCVFIILLMYIKIGYDFNKGLDIYNGPIGRTIFTQVGTLFLHVDLFPYYIPYLGGRSFSPTILKLFLGGVSQFRSGRVVMNFYSPEKVVGGTAGVMNSLFIGEAYANFGTIGVLSSVLYIGLLLSIILIIFVKIKKTPINIVIYVTITSILASASQGGFIDFVYNFNIIFITVTLILISLFAKYMDKIKILKNIKVYVLKFTSLNIKIKKEDKNEC